MKEVLVPQTVLFGKTPQETASSSMMEKLEDGGLVLKKVWLLVIIFVKVSIHSHILMIFTIASIWILNSYVYKSSLGGSNSLPITSEEWSGDYCESDGTVQVKCTKINGKPLEKILAPDHILG